MSPRPLPTAPRSLLAPSTSARRRRGRPRDREPDARRLAVAGASERAAEERLLDAGGLLRGAGAGGRLGAGDDAALADVERGRDEGAGGERAAREGGAEGVEVVDPETPARSVGRLAAFGARNALPVRLGVEVGARVDDAHERTRLAGQVGRL